MSIPPLLSRRILITRTEEQAEGFAQKLRDLGAEPVILPLITLSPPDDWGPLDQTIRELHCYDWVIFTSASGVRFFLERLYVLGYSTEHLRHVKLATIGPATAKALEQHGLSVAFVPSRYLAEAIAPELGDLQKKRILLPRADIARKDLNRLLQAKGAHVEEVVAYRTRAASRKVAQVEQLFQQGIDIITFTSASTVRALAKLLPRHLLRGVTVACIGPITARAVEEAGWRVHIVAQEHTIDGLISAILQGVGDHAGNAHPAGA